MFRSFAILFFVFTGASLLTAQSEFEVEMGLFTGGEYNIFKSPDVLLDRATMEPFPRDSIIYTDFFADAEYDIEYTREGRKSLFELGSDLWYRNYVEFRSLNQSRLDADVFYQYFLTDGLAAGGEYEFRWSNRIGTSVTGDLLMRSFKYLGHTGGIFLGLYPSEALYMQLLGEYEYKDYYDEQTRDPLDHANLEVNYSLEAELNRNNEIELEVSWTDRNYFQYRSLDSNGDYLEGNPMRNFRYYKGEFDYNWSPVFGLRINPGVEVTRRVDMFQDYYSYMAYSGSLRLRYFTGNFYVSLYGDYKQLSYDLRPAFTSETDDPMLVYGYFDVAFTFRYSITEQWDIYVIAESDNRDSNTDLEYFKTRRPYNTYQAMIGVTYSLPDMRW